MEKWEYKKITFQMMLDYIQTNCPNDIEWFKSVALSTDDEGNKHYQHLMAKRAFCERYMPDLIPITKVVKVNAKEILESL